MRRIREILTENIVTALFVVLCLFAYIASKQQFSFVLSEVMSRLMRNCVLVLSLIIPVIAGLGLNFGIILGAMAAQISIIVVLFCNLQGMLGMITCFLLATPLSVLLGIGMGVLFNKAKGQEMITGLIMGFFANGVYQFLLLIVVGKVIHIENADLIIPETGGVKDTILLSASMQSVIDKLWKVSFDRVLMVMAACGLIWLLYQMVQAFRNGDKYRAYWKMCCGILLVGCYGVTLVQPSIRFAVEYCDVPVVSMLLWMGVYLLIRFLSKTKLGQDFRAIGQDMGVANSAGISVDRARITATIISTVLASWGQLISLQNLGSFSTYSSHEQVSTFAIAALLVGGASAKKATARQAILGIILFHTLFVVAPMAGKNLLNNATYGEYFRTFVSYGVIALALALHAFSKKQKRMS